MDKYYSGGSNQLPSQHKHRTAIEAMVASGDLDRAKADKMIADRARQEDAIQAAAGNKKVTKKEKSKKDPFAGTTYEPLANVVKSLHDTYKKLKPPSSKNKNTKGKK